MPSKEELVDTARIDALLEPHASRIGADYPGYRNHVVRVATYARMLAPDTAQARHRIEIAGVFHDLGIWLADSFDYLAPSMHAARAYLENEGLTQWADEIETIIGQHHKLTRFDDPRYPLVEPFRRADLVDVSWGTIRFGLSRTAIRQVKQAWPNRGFHRMLARRAAGWIRRHPLDPMPMMKW